MILKRLFRLPVVLCLLLLCGVVQVIAQAERPRLVRPSSSRPVNTPPAENPNKTSATYRPPLVNKIAVSKPVNQPVTMPSVKKTVSSVPMSPALAVFNQKLLSGIQSRLGISYNYGSEGPNYYDCSGFVWSVFQEAGINFERSSAHSFWNNFEPVSDEDKYKFGTLVFFNHLGHMGIVADEKGFYHASSSKGITWSPFAGYWEKRVVGFRRVPLKQY